MNWKKIINIRSVDFKFHRRRNKNYPTDYTVRIYKTAFGFRNFFTNPWHFKTKQEAIDFIAKKLLEQDWTD